jgi:hypothetical protein
VVRVSLLVLGYDQCCGIRRYMLDLGNMKQAAYSPWVVGNCYILGGRGADVAFQAAFM